VDVRVQATDVFGNSSAFSPWLTLTVDAQEPALELDAATQSALLDGFIGPSEAPLSGTAGDDHLLSGVEMCKPSGLCAPTALTLDPATVPQATFTYEDKPAAPVWIDVPDACGAGTAGLVRTFSVTEVFTVTEVQLGLNLTHPQRSDALVSLTSPDATTVELIQFNESVNAPHLDVLLTDATDQPVTTGREFHDVTHPHYDVVRQPSNPLTVFRGESATGDWELVICDTHPDADAGAFNHAQLVLKADRLPVDTTGTWSYRYPFTGRVDAVLVTRTLYALDSVGNRMEPSMVVTFTADNVAPQLVVTQTVSVIDITGDPRVVLEGWAKDSGRVNSVMLHLYTPYGESQIVAPDSISWDGDGFDGAATWDWDYTLLPITLGDYTITVMATDGAGNVTSRGPYVVRVREKTAFSYLPLVLSAYRPEMRRSAHTHRW
jgi:subtilisin-like proprotein convertase family protein